MNIVQEDTVRQLYLKRRQTEIRIEKGDYVTRQAMDYIKDNGLTLVVEGALPENREIRPATGGGPMVTQDGQTLGEKPEHMTHLHGSVLVPKSHPCIALRGQLDSLQADIILLQTQTCAAGEDTLTGELGELLELCRAIMSSEVTGRELPPLRVLGLDDGALRAQSQQPRAYFGVGHLLADYRMGAVTAALNRLRAHSRQVELAAVGAFCRPDGTAERTDLLRALNRLSSAFYILMLRREKGRG